MHSVQFLKMEKNTDLLFGPTYFFDQFLREKSCGMTGSASSGIKLLNFVYFSHKNFPKWAAYLQASSTQICGPFGEILWLDEFSKLLLNKMDFSLKSEQMNLSSVMSGSAGLLECKRFYIFLKGSLSQKGIKRELS